MQIEIVASRYPAIVNMATPKQFYPIGTPGISWTDVEREQWRAGTQIHRSYKEEVLDKVHALGDDVWEVITYGALSHDPQRYPLLVVKSHNWQPTRPYLLVTGGVHGYETSGVQGAILFLQTQSKYADQFNILVAPCVSPWAYEHIQRWNADLKDPNRSFKKDNQTEESRALMTYLESLNVVTWTCHLDLHETTDSDVTEFMPAKHAEAGLLYDGEHIPDGFYLVGDSSNEQLDFQKAVIDSVRNVTHIAPNDDKGCLIDDIPAVIEGVILVDVKEMGLCGGVTGGMYSTTTEVYPDSATVTGEECNRAQVAAITGALEYVLSQQK